MGGQGRAAWHLLRKEGFGAVRRRALWDLGRRFVDGELDFPLLPGDIADSGALDLRAAAAAEPGRALRIGWVVHPPSPGSGGHTTLFRMVAAAEAAGHRCTVLLYDRYGGDPADRARVIRAGWPQMRAEIRDASRLDDLDVVVASSWDTAHVVATRTRNLPVHRAYFVQDYEPWFHPRGSEYALAEDTYRFGFHTITVGPMLASLLADEHGVEATVARFGCDTDVYRRTNFGARNGIAFYARLANPRRGFRLGALALAEFHRRHPEIEVHMYGDADARVDFPVTSHGSVSPEALCDIYNRCVAGLALSFTNVTLITEELLACGVVPVANDDPHAKASMANPQVRWVTPTPSAIADALSDAVESTDGAELAAATAASVESGGWEPAAEATVRSLESLATTGVRIPNGSR